jgi:hypothetical protein
MSAPPKTGVATSLDVPPKRRRTLPDAAASFVLFTVTSVRPTRESPPPLPSSQWIRRVTGTHNLSKCYGEEKNLAPTRTCTPTPKPVSVCCIATARDPACIFTLRAGLRAPYVWRVDLAPELNVCEQIRSVCSLPCLLTVHAFRSSRSLGKPLPLRQFEEGLGCTSAPVYHLRIGTGSSSVAVVLFAYLQM